MKIFLFIFCYTTLTYETMAQTWDWALQGGGTGSDFGQDVATDQNGNLFVAANFMGNTNYANYQLGGVSVANCLVAKHDSLGNVLWLNRANYANSGCIGVDKIGNCYLAGNCGNSTFYDNNGSTQVTQQGNGDAFIAKYNQNGILQWVKLFGYANSNDICNAIKIDSAGNSYIVGNASFMSGNFAILAKYNNQGQLIWTATNWTGSANQTGLDIDKAGNCFVTGTFQDSIMFGNTKLIAGAMNRSVFIVKYDKNGNAVWAKKDGTNYDFSQSISLNQNGSFAITGSFKDPSVFGSHLLSNGSNAKSMFIAKYDTSGNCQWAKYASEGTAGKKITTNSTGRYFIAGNMGLVATFGEGTNAVTLTSTKHNGELFIAEYDGTGTLNWVKQPGGSNYDYNFVSSVCSDEHDNCYLTGGFSQTTSFGATSLFAPNATHGYCDIFIAKLKSTGESLGLSAETLKNSAFTIYPNPSSGIFTLNYSSLEKGSLEIKITNVKGQTIFAESISHFTGEYTKDIDLSKYAKGIYLVEIIANRKRTIRKLVLD